jgi:lipopolysaccharide heptosyltransferase II
MKRNFLSNKYESVDLRVRVLLFLIDVIGCALFCPLKIFNRIFKKYDPQKVKKILIFRLDGLGDVVLSSAALREIRQGFPQAEITLVVGPWAKDIARNLPFYNHLIVHRCFFFSFFRGDKKIRLREELKFLKKIRQTKYDLGIDLRGDLLSIIPLFLSKTKFRFARAGRGGGFLLTHSVKWDRTKIKHEKNKALKLVEALGIPIKNRDLELDIQQEDIRYVKRYLSEKGISQSDFIVSIAPCSLFYWKSWRPERFAKTASMIDKNYNAKVILIGSREEKDVLDKVQRMADCRVINTAGQLSLSQVAALINLSAVFIGNDSGLIHIAAAVKTPMIQLFGPGQPEVFGYRDNRSIILMKGDCLYRPCRERDCKNKQDWCMDKISVEDVMEAFEEIYQRNCLAVQKKSSNNKYYKRRIIK